MNDNPATEVSIVFPDGTEREFDRDGVLFDPVAWLVLRVDGAWLSGDSAHNEVRPVGFFTLLLEALAALSDESSRERILLFDDTYLSFERVDGGVEVGLRYSEEAIDDPDRRLPIAREATTDLEALAAAALAGASEVHDRVTAHDVPADARKLKRLRGAMWALRERVGR